MKPLFENITHTAPCPDPGLPSNGKRDGSDFGHDQTVTFQCNDNYSLVGNDSMSCNDGVWSGNLPQCKGNSQSKNSKVFETKRLTQGTLFCAL
ncbi:C4b-binding protein beta chain-like [Acropora palmata]|uniref:C4b-binding protein beta chain-like n=1 Tax=Acropora palmata TaxID=6131 RepID=UPI003DA063BD